MCGCLELKVHERWKAFLGCKKGPLVPHEDILMRYQGTPFYSHSHEVPRDPFLHPKLAILMRYQGTPFYTHPHEVPRDPFLHPEIAILITPFTAKLRRSEASQCRSAKFLL